MIWKDKRLILNKRRNMIVSESNCNANRGREILLFDETLYRANFLRPTKERESREGVGG